ncbi:MAG: hypothetical protein ABSB59_23995 [Streptosporangiaceae bacterium]|jgi:hypothetical protein
MNDNELITALREQRGKVPMDTPVEQIISRGRAVRARRRIPRVAGALGAAAAAAFAVSMLLPASPPASAPHAQLAAWTVARQGDGSIQVTIRQLRDPAGLQRTLRADGVPASVTFTGQQNPACQGYPGGGSQSQRRHLLSSVVTEPAGRDAMAIHPSALPSGGGLQIYTLFQNYPGPHGSFQVAVGLVQASPQCTGS